jgi:hypothetical protein
MSVSNDFTTTIDNDEALFSSKFLEFCAKVRKDDPSILPEVGEHFRMNSLLSEKNVIKLADALLENTSVTHLQLDTEMYTKSSAEAMAKYVRTSKRLQRIRWELPANNHELKHHEEFSVVFYLHFKRVRRSRNFTLASLAGLGRPSWRSKKC